MAQKQTATIFILLSIIAICSIQVSALGGGMVGGRTKIPDVKTNKEIQQLGKYCVEEYNKNQHKSNNGGDASASATKVLMFSQVLEAEKQVVSGIKYYLKISASNSNGVPKMFDAVVVVTPWVKKSLSRELLDFSPSPATK